MSNFLIESTLRPLRSAIVVDVENLDALTTAVVVLSSHWGGMLSCIVPITVSNSKCGGPFERQKVAVHNLLECFEPDFVYVFEDSHKKYLSPIWPTFLLEKSTHFQIGKLGLSIFPCILGFSRSLWQNGSSCLQIFSGHEVNSLQDLWSSILLGALPSWLSEEFTNFYSKPLSVRYVDIVKELHSNPDSHSPSVLNVGCYGINRLSRADRAPDMILVIDRASARHMIDYWNLRALGIEILPALIGDEHLEQTLINGLCESDRAVDIRHLRDTDVGHLTHINSVASSIAGVQVSSRIIDIENLNPAHWRTDRIKGLVEVRKFRCSEADARIEFPILKPGFFDELRDKEWGSGVLWINTAIIHSLKSNPDFAKVLPLCIRGRSYQFGDDRSPPNTYNSEGFILGCGMFKSETHFDLPNSWTVLKTYLKLQDLRAQRPPSAISVLELLGALGELPNIKYFANRTVLELFEDLAQGLIESESEENFSEEADLENLGVRIKRVKGHTVSLLTLLKVLASSPSGTKQLAEKAIQFYIDKGILVIGLRCTCPQCKHRNWYPVSELQEELRCERCLRRYKFRQYPPKESDWEYKTTGIFSQKNYASGSYAVLLTVQAVSALLPNSFTWFPGVEVKLAGNHFESDLVMLTSNESARHHDQPTFLIGEIKSFGGCLKEIRKLYAWTKLIPDVTVVIASLSDDFSLEEKRLLEELAIFGRKECERYNPRVVMLTARELLCRQPPPQCWEGRADFAGIQSLFQQCNLINDRPISRLEALAYSTQHIYLGITHPFHRA